MQMYLDKNKTMKWNELNLYLSDVNKKKVIHVYKLRETLIQKQLVILIFANTNMTRNNDQTAKLKKKHSKCVQHHVHFCTIYKRDAEEG